MNPWRRGGRPLAIAHRGQSIDAPENTLVAYRAAVELGAEMIEADVNITRDGHLAMIHDHVLDRTTSGTGPVSAISWTDLLELDAGSWFGPGFSGARVPAVADLLDLAQDAGVALCLEVKGGNGAEARAIAERLLDLMVERNAFETCVMSGYDHEVLAWAKSNVAELHVAPDRLPDNVLPDAKQACAQATAIGAAVLQNHHAFLTADLVAALHDLDIAVWSWPTTDEASLETSVLMGADGVMGDDIRTMLAVLERYWPRAGTALPPAPDPAMMRDG